MNKRIVSMIRKLSKTEQEISLTELAEEFQISQRTVRNDLNAINDLLTEQGLANLKLGRGGKACAKVILQRFWKASMKRISTIINYPKKNAMPFLERSFMSRSMHTNVS